MRKTLLSTLGIMIMLCVIFLGYEIRYGHKKVVNNMMAIYLEEEKGTGKYQKTNLYKWPNNSEYALNMHKTYCENGSILRYNLETNKINVKVKGTDKCYVYFDKASYGTEDHPYLIQTIEDLVKLSNKVNSGTTYEGEYFLLTNDLDFKDASDYEDANRTDFKDINGINGNEALIKELTTGSGFKPIGNASQTFQGNFDGGNHTISNLYIKNEIEGTNLRLGLFGEAHNATMKNITLKGQITSTVRAVIGSISGGIGETSFISNVTNYVTITSESSEYDIGGIIGGNYGTTTIENCQNYGDISGSRNLGGIVGYTGYKNGILTIKNCINYGNLTNDIGVITGGIVGFGTTVTTIKINNSHNEGEILNNVGTTANYVGGLAGLVYGNIEINDSYNIGNVTANGENGTFVGGLIGRVNQKATINNSYNSNNVIKISPNGFDISEYIGGLIGYIANQSEISILKNNYNTGEIFNGTRVGGLLGALESGIIIDKCYNTGNINVTDEIWASMSQIGGLIGANISYAYFHPIDITLNSYNIGNITANNKTGTVIIGLIGNFHSNKLILLNSYNAGNLNLLSNLGFSSVSGLVQSSGRGLQGQSTENSTNILRNVYNIGTISGEANKYSLGYFDSNSTTNNIQNTYYVNSVIGSNIADMGIAMTLEQMKLQTFVDQLNQNIENINLSEIDESLKDYKLSKWILGSDGYPTLINE